MKQLLEIHPYPMFIPNGVESMIIGTFPAWEFTSKNPKNIDSETMIDFNYGRIKGKNANLLWKLLSEIFQRDLTNAEAIKNFLDQKKIGMADVCHQVIRKKPRNSSDNNLSVQEFNIELAHVLNSRQSIKRLLFTSGKAFEWYKLHIASYVNRSDLKLILLPSPSGSANRWIGGLDDYKNGKFKDTYDYRLERYQEHFKKA